MTTTTDRAPASAAERAQRFRDLHDRLLVLPNAWDACSAAIVVAAGAAAVATTSGGVAWSLGRGDGELLTREETAEVVRRIAQAVDVPVTADVEGGYGPAPEDVARTVGLVVSAGAVGVNVEDLDPGAGSLHPVDAQVARIAAAREAAAAAGLPGIVVNARTDVHLRGVGAADTRLDETVERARRYVAAGADCVFVPGLLDLPELETLARAVPAPINAMAVPGGPSVAALAAAGVRRVSVGTALAEAAYTTARAAATAFLQDGELPVAGDALDYGALQALSARG
ncbi:isocitrate lyase/phosphoenolpyruvate mutase family protein [Cellulomonas sp. zg-ZUI199]|uniref:Isocitrate lyase/phosphoenolpyruvate mutase family protein n=1 Tax=Cellulomonas wangleii TaxID=2816956 RepID=A0ABX8D4N2_9CELL|nr:isocitrate lyase/phosphoenolpyruvate mutase family protein [Cellulomonas wangleii]MBO0924427.1 isocitrate lyase/phosphoenolpyruvate mutase family protein [Cellulomonas wangleii]QVI62423.1 isocitrate lyase/phosphoenolpyruvate mutase family protein [Cellulomonas wangleii]